MPSPKFPPSSTYWRWLNSCHANQLQLHKDPHVLVFKFLCYHLILSWTQSVTTRRQETSKQSPSKAAPKSSYSHVVKTALQPCDPGKVSPDMSRVVSHDTSTPLVSCDPRAHDPGNKPHDLPRDWSSIWSHVTTRSHDQTHFKHAPSPLIGTWKTMGTINGLLNNQRSHKTLIRSTKAHPSSVFVPALKYGPPI